MSLDVGRSWSPDCEFPEPWTIEDCVQMGHVAHSQGTAVRQERGWRTMWLWNNAQRVPTTYLALLPWTKVAYSFQGSVSLSVKLA